MLIENGFGRLFGVYTMSCLSHEEINQIIHNTKARMAADTGPFMVMSATEITPGNINQARCFDRNAIDFASKAEAQAEAARRNAVEIAAGHTNVTWFVCIQ